MYAVKKKYQIRYECGIGAEKVVHYVTGQRHTERERQQTRWKHAIGRCCVKDGRSNGLAALIVFAAIVYV